MNVDINLSVADFVRSRAVFAALGFAFNDTFSDDTAGDMVICEPAHAMLLTHEKAATFAPRTITASALPIRPALPLGEV